MARHGETMTNLLNAVVLLDRARIRVLAGRVADEEVVARASTPPGGRPVALPRELAAQQAKLSLTARQLVAAASEAGDDRGLAERFGELTATCVTCHSVILHGRGGPSPFGSKTGAP
jgi:hypothetical protein